MNSNRLKKYNQKRVTFNSMRHAMNWSKKDDSPCKGHFCRLRRMIEYRSNNGDMEFQDINPIT